jgi:hypothetical protein
MSNAAALATVTAVLKDLLNNGLLNHDALTHVGEVIVTALPPDRIDVPETKSQLNLFLYLVTPNLGWRNVGLPSRDDRGDLVSAPPLALDLHYLLSVYGAKEFHAEILLGYAMNLLHEMPVLTRAGIRQSLSNALQVDNGTSVPPDLKDLATSGLADQVEMIKITPNFLSTEEMFKLWMAFQTPYRPTTGYHVSVVLIDSDRQGKAALPVRERNLYAVPFRQPVIEEILSRSAPLKPFVKNQAILTGYRLALIGRQLRGDDTRVLIDGVELAPNAVQVSDARIEFDLPAGLSAGVHGVQVALMRSMGTPAALHRGVESAASVFVLCPQVTQVAVNVTKGQGQPNTVPRDGTLTLTVTPPVGRDQRVVLLLNELGAPAGQPPLAHRFLAPPRDPQGPATSNTVDVPFTQVLPRTYLVRLQVDGAESPLDVDANGKFAIPSRAIP